MSTQKTGEDDGKRRRKGSGTVYWHAATKSWCAMLKKMAKPSRLTERAEMKHSVS